MAPKCVFCKEQLESSFPPCLEENKMFMFEILMEQTSFDKEQFLGSPMCEDCDKTVLNFFNFKSNFMETEDEFLNYTNSDNKLDLYNVLVQTGKIKKFSDEQLEVKVCRICFKATQVEDYKEIKSSGGSLVKMVTMCLPEFNMDLTVHTYLCTECYSILLQYYHFLLLCSEVTRSRKRRSSDVSDLLNTTDSLNVEDPVNKKQKMNEADDVFEKTFLLLRQKVKKRKGKGRRKKPKYLPKSEHTKKQTLPQKRKRTPIQQGAPSRDLRPRPEKPEVPPVQPKPVVPKQPKPAGLKQPKLQPQEDLVDTYECQICPQVLYNLNALEYHIKSHVNDKEFFCWKCGFECLMFGALKKHYAVHKMDVYKTVQVKKSTLTEEDFSELSKDDHQYTPIQDDKSIEMPIKLGRPMLHQFSPQLVSTVNNAEVTSTNEFEECTELQENPIDTEYYECQVCPGIFDDIQSLREHIANHRKENSILCWKCDKRFRGLGKLRLHFQSHGIDNVFKVINRQETPSTIEQEPVLSTEDNSSVPKKRSWKRKHQTPLQDNPNDTEYYECQVCPGVFYDISSLRRHMVNHQIENDLLCWKCNKRFENFEKFRLHYMKHRIGGLYKVINQQSSSNIGQKISASTVANKKNTSSSPTQSTAKIACIHCKNSYYGISAYINHMCSYESKILCNSCKKEFNDVTEYVEHECGVKKKQEFSCGHCSGLFFSLDDLDEHDCRPLPMSSSGKSGVASLEEMNEKNFITNRPEKSTTNIGDLPALPKAGPVSTTTEPEYECSYCLHSFRTIMALDQHTCKEDSDKAMCNSTEISKKILSPPVTDSEIVASKYTNTARILENSYKSSKNLEIPKIKEEGLFECSSCLVLFETVQTFTHHKCSNTQGSTEPGKSPSASNQPYVTLSGGVYEENNSANSSLSELPQNSADLFSRSAADSNRPEFPVTKSTATRNTADIFWKKSASTMPVTPTCTVTSADQFPVIKISSDIFNQHSIRDRLPSSTNSYKQDIVGNLSSTAKDNINRLIKNEPDVNDDYLSSSDSSVDLGIENLNQIKNGNEIPSCSQIDNPAGSESIAKSKNGKPKKLKPIDKKEVIVKIANMFGVKIIEGKDGNKENQDQNRDVQYTCVGCDFKTPNYRDFRFHYTCCEKVLRCNYCSYMTNISHKLEIHSWSVHNIIIYICSYCSFSTSMEENFTPHLLTHKEYVLERDSRAAKPDQALEDNMPDNDRNSSDDEDIDENDITTDNSAVVFNSCVFNDRSLKNFDRNKFEKVLAKVKNQKNDRGKNITGSGIEIATNLRQTDPSHTEVSKNGENTIDSEKTLSADEIWPGLDDDLDNSEAFELKPDPETGTYRLVENAVNVKNPLAVEPVSLVESSILKENLAAQLTLEKNNDIQNQSELIIPDRIVVEQLAPVEIKVEPAKNESVHADNQCTTPNVESNLPNVKSNLASNEPVETVVINCDSDSDSEFVESATTKLSTVAANIEEVCTISASEATELISQGVPVVTEANLVGVQIGSYMTVAEMITSSGGTLTTAEDNSFLQSTANNTSQESTGSNEKETDNQNTVEDSSNISISAEKEFVMENSNEKEINSTNITMDTQQTESSILPINSGDKYEETKENSNNIETSVCNNDCSDNEEATEKDNIVHTTIVREYENEGAESDGSSIFVTDNEDSDRDDVEELRNKSSKSSTNIQNVIEKGHADKNQSKKDYKESNSNKVIKSSVLPIDIDVDVIISDDDDTNIEKNSTKNSLLIKSVPAASKSGGDKGLTILSNVIIPVSPTSRTTTASPANISNNSEKSSVVEINDSDEDDSTIRQKESEIISANSKIVNATSRKKNTIYASEEFSDEDVFDGLVKDTSISKGVSAKSNENMKKASGSKNSTGVVAKDSCFVIDIDDDDDDNDDDWFESRIDKEISTDNSNNKNNKTGEVKSRNSSSSSDIVSRDFSQEADDESSRDADYNSGNDCVFVSEEGGIQQSKNMSSSDNSTKPLGKPRGRPIGIKGAPNALHLFISKVTNEIKQKYPNLKWGAQRGIIMDAWRNMSDEDKWPFKEEARLHRLLFLREHPEYQLNRKRPKKQRPTVKSLIAIQPRPSVNHDEIVVDKNFIFRESM